ncbi:hypothetical protein OG474_09850 [Kribbella sp. NBC_01505]|uniref:hypothetical protein n=1 Tax=Kribbella sp. NBC_01505 TaxID=2903580 RepID=UPI0038657DCE
MSFNKDTNIPTLDADRILGLIGPWPKKDSAYVTVVSTGRKHHRLDRDGARALRDALSAAIEERDAAEHPPEPKIPSHGYNVGDRVEVFGYCDEWDGVGTVVNTDYLSRYQSLLIAFDGVRRAAFKQGGFGFGLEYVRPYTPDYAALAAEFKPGDTAIVSDNPGTKAEPGSAYVSPIFYGKAVNVIDHPDLSGFHSRGQVLVALGNGDTNFVHVAHLARAVAVPA